MNSKYYLAAFTDSSPTIQRRDWIRMWFEGM